tara:strand:- start:2869 stop:3114 length:246 start_codon:yes stop_codon:yes gene_type:complete
MELLSILERTLDLSWPIFLAKTKPRRKLNLSKVIILDLKDTSFVVGQRSSKYYKSAKPKRSDCRYQLILLRLQKEGQLSLW